jgi:hypothetical protein
MEAPGDREHDYESVPNDATDLARPGWITDELIKQTIRVWDLRSSTPLPNDSAVRLILTIGQLLDATGMTKVEEDNEEVHGMGKSE